MDLQHAPSPRRSGTYIHELRTQEGRRALAGAALVLQCPSWYRPGTSAGRTAESTVRPARSARRMHPARAFDPACSSDCWWLLAFLESCQCSRCLPPCIPGSLPRISTTKSALRSRQSPVLLSLAARQRISPNPAAGTSGQPLLPGGEEQLGARPEGQWDARWLRAACPPPVAAAWRRAHTLLPPPLPMLVRRRHRGWRCPALGG